jgi:Family of unknown function (DUF6338)
MFETFSGVILLIIFLVPGFVWRTVEGQLVYLDKRLEWEKFALGLLSRSTLVYLPFAPLLYHLWEDQWLDRHPLWTSLVALGMIVILPTLYGLCAGTWRQKRWGARLLEKLGLKTFEQHHIPTAWDHLFSKIRPAWVVVTLKNGNKVYGFMGTASYLSSESEERDIYISHTLQPSESGEMEFVKNTRGIYIAASEVSVISFTET